MSGDFDPDKVIAIIDKYFGSWKANPTLSRPEYAPCPHSPLPPTPPSWARRQRT